MSLEIIHGTDNGEVIVEKYDQGQTNIKVFPNEKTFTEHTRLVEAVRKIIAGERHAS